MRRVKQHTFAVITWFTSAMIQEALSMKRYYPVTVAATALLLFCLLVSITPATYLVEGTANTLGLQFQSKEAYVQSVNGVRILYLLIFIALMSGLVLQTYSLMKTLNCNRWNSAK